MPKWFMDMQWMLFEAKQANPNVLNSYFSWRIGDGIAEEIMNLSEIIGSSVRACGVQQFGGVRAAVDRTIGKNSVVLLMAVPVSTRNLKEAVEEVVSA